MAHGHPLDDDTPRDSLAESLTAAQRADRETAGLEAWRPLLFATSIGGFAGLCGLLTASVYLHNMFLMVAGTVLILPTSAAARLAGLAMGQRYIVDQWMRSQPRHPHHEPSTQPRRPPGRRVFAVGPFTLRRINTHEVDAGLSTDILIAG